MPRRLAWAAAGLLAIALGYAAWPRQGDLRGFDPDAVGRGEARMWRHYYARRRFALCADLYGLSRSQFGCSPIDSVRIAFHAARAARRFQTSASRAEAQRALPPLRRYYAIIGRTGHSTFDTAEAARLELEWWQQRREGVPPEGYARTIAAGAGVVYAMPSAAFEAAARRRARAMQYRDARGRAGMTAADWDHVAAELVAAYAEMKTAIDNRAR